MQWLQKNKKLVETTTSISFVVAGAVLLVSFFFLPWARSASTSESVITGVGLAFENFKAIFDPDAYELLQYQGGLEDAIVQRFLTGFLLLLIPLFGGSALWGGAKSLIRPSSVTTSQSTPFVDRLINSAKDNRQVGLLLLVLGFFIPIMFCSGPFFLPLMWVYDDLSPASGRIDAAEGFWLCVLVGVVGVLAWLALIVVMGRALMNSSINPDATNSEPPITQNFD